MTQDNYKLKFEFEAQNAQQFERALKSIDTTMRALGAGADEAGDGLEKVGKKSGKTKGETHALQGALDEITGTIKGLGVAGVAGVAIAGMVKMGEAAKDLTQKLYEMGKAGAAANDIERGFKALGDMAPSMERLKRASRGAIDATTLQSAARLGHDLALTTDEMEKAVMAATALAGKYPETGTASENLQAILNGEAEQLRKLGIVIDKGTRRYEGLSEAGQKLATIQEVAEQATRLNIEAGESQSLTFQALEADIKDGISQVQQWTADVILNSEEWDQLGATLDLTGEILRDNEDLFKSLIENGIKAMDLALQGLNATIEAFAAGARQIESSFNFMQDFVAMPFKMANKQVAKDRKGWAGTGLTVADLTSLEGQMAFAQGVEDRNQLAQAQLIGSGDISRGAFVDNLTGTLLAPLHEDRDANAGERRKAELERRRRALLSRRRSGRSSRGREGDLGGFLLGQGEAITGALGGGMFGESGFGGSRAGLLGALADELGDEKGEMLADLGSKIADGFREAGTEIGTFIEQMEQVAEKQSWWTKVSVKSVEEQVQIYADLGAQGATSIGQWAAAFGAGQKEMSYIRFGVESFEAIAAAARYDFWAASQHAAAATGALLVATGAFDGGGSGAGGAARAGGRAAGSGISRSTFGPTANLGAADDMPDRTVIQLQVDGRKLGEEAMRGANKSARTYRRRTTLDARAVNRGMGRSFP